MLNVKLHLILNAILEDSVTTSVTKELAPPPP